MTAKIAQIPRTEHGLRLLPFDCASGVESTLSPWVGVTFRSQQRIEQPRHRRSHEPDGPCPVAKWSTASTYLIGGPKLPRRKTVYVVAVAMVAMTGEPTMADDFTEPDRRLQRGSCRMDLAGTCASAMAGSPISRSDTPIP